jgi:hypothetical protein
MPHFSFENNCMTKSDLYPDSAPISDTKTRYLSAKTGNSVRAWLDETLSAEFRAGTKILEIDYEEYARAEAALAWLNLSFTFEPISPGPPASVIGPLMDNLDSALTAASIPIVHLKMMVTSPAGWLKAAICANGEEPVIEGDLDTSNARVHDVIVNLRATGSPSHVQRIVRRELGRFVGSIHHLRLNCFSPAPPNPERKG